jgi:hypothetical protein
MTVFIDLKAFDSIDRNVLMKTMRERRIRKELVIKIEEIIRETKNKVRIGQTEEE